MNKEQTMFTFSVTSPPGFYDTFVVFSLNTDTNSPSLSSVHVAKRLVDFIAYSSDKNEVKLGLTKNFPTELAELFGYELVPEGPAGHFKDRF